MELQNIFTDDKGTIRAFAESRIGGRPENQDSYGWQTTPLGYLVTVCDGMGGGPGGKTASTIAVREIVAGITEAAEDEEIPNILIKAVRRANMAIIEAGNEKPALKGMGSTATVLLITEESAFVAHVGDSRVYQIRGGKKVFRTFDHSMVFEMVRQGVITEEQARLSAQSNVITRTLGIKPDVEVDVQELPYEAGDRFALCTDGIHGSMPEEEFIKMLANKKSKLGLITDDIATVVDNIGRTTGGGHDNLTLAIVETLTNSKLKPQMSKQTKFTILGIVALLVISVVLNITQLTSSHGTPDTQAMQDSIIELNTKLHELDSVKSDTIKTLRQTVKEQKQIIDKVANAVNK